MVVLFGARVVAEVHADRQSPLRMERHQVNARDQLRADRDIYTTVFAKICQQQEMGALKESARVQAESVSALKRRKQQPTARCVPTGLPGSLVAQKVHAAHAHLDYCSIVRDIAATTGAELLLGQPKASPRIVVKGYRKNMRAGLIGDCSIVCDINRGLLIVDTAREFAGVLQNIGRRSGGRPIRGFA